MNRTLLLLLVAVFSLTAYSQRRPIIGGEFSVWRNTETKDFALKISPSLMFELNKNMDIGFKLGYSYSQNDNVATPNYMCYTFSLSPFLRHNLLISKYAELFVDYTAGYCYNGKAETRNGFEVGIKPGITIPVYKRLRFVASYGFLGYRQDFHGYENGYGLKLSSENLNVGFLFEL